MATSKREKRALEEDEDELVGNDELNLQLQPHLIASQRTAASSTSQLYAYDGPASRDDVSALDAPTSQTDVTVDARSTSLRTNVASSGDAVNGMSSQTSPASTNGIAADAVHVTAVGQSETSTSANPVFYDGQSVVMQAPVVVTRSDGSRTIHTHQIAEHWREYERPLRQRKIKILKVVSIVAMIIFFPTGIPAFYYARRTEQEFEAGIMRGNIDRALKFARRTEHLIIFSFVLVIAVVILVFALVEQSIAHGGTYIHRGVITGQ